MDNQSEPLPDLMQAESAKSIQLARAQLASQAFSEANPIYCCQLDGKGHMLPIHADSLATVANPCWIHLDYMDTQSINWLKNTPLVPEIAKVALLESAPVLAREVRFDNSLLVIVKSVNISSGSLPDPIATLRCFITDNLIISTRHQRVEIIDSLKNDLSNGVGPVDVADWLVHLCDLISEQASLSNDRVHNQLVKLEDEILNQHMISHKEIGRVRKYFILLRRFMVPARDIFAKIATERVSWIDDNDKQHLHDISLTVNHSIEDINSSLLRLASLMEQINALLTESMNKRIYLMTLFTLIFMPITFLASLFGVNLAGIPFQPASWSFAIFSLFLVVIGIGFACWLKLKKWI